MNRKSIWTAFCAGSIFLGMSACARVLMGDFEKATEVDALDLTQKHAYSKAIELPHGEAEIVFVARGYDCTKPIDATVEISATTARGAVKQMKVELSDLTWPRSSDGCRPIGYLRLDNESMTRPLRFTIGSGDNPIKFVVSVTQTSSRKQPVAIWVVYNDRNPIDRMLGEAK